MGARRYGVQRMVYIERQMPSPVETKLPDRDETHPVQSRALYCIEFLADQI